MDEWKPHPISINYESSKLGQVRNIKTNRILNGSKCKGYIVIGINGKTKSRGNFVAETWLPPKPQDGKKYTLDHINRIRHDDRVVNLRWATHREQLLNRKKVVQKGQKRKVDQICLTTRNVLKTFSSLTSANCFFKKPKKCSHISKVCRGKQKTAYGFKWAYSSGRICPNERWKIIEEHPTHKISTYGRVKTPTRGIVDFMNFTRNALYPHVKIQNKQYKIHILVGHAFLGYNPQKPLYNHKNGDKWDPRLENLEQCTHTENINHAYDTGLTSLNKRIQLTHTKTNIAIEFRSMAKTSKYLGKNNGYVSKYFRKKRTDLVQGYKIEQIE